MAIFRGREHADIDPFTDLLFNALLTFSFLFLVALLMLNPPANSGIIDPKAEFMVTVSWPDGDLNDIDVWAAGPGGERISYLRPQDGLMHLDRDDRGMSNDRQFINGHEIVNPLNQEVLTIRGRPPGEYTINVHYFKSENQQAVPVTVYLAEVNPSLRVLHYSTAILDAEGDEATALRFTLTDEGQLVDINQLPRKLVGASQ